MCRHFIVVQYGANLYADNILNCVIYIYISFRSSYRIGKQWALTSGLSSV